MWVRLCFCSVACNMCRSRNKSSCKYHMAEEQQASGGRWGWYVFFRVSYSELSPWCFLPVVFRVGFFCVLFLSCVGISISASVLVDPVTGLSTTSSVLEYSAKKEDANAQFACRTVEDDLVSQPVTFTITCESPDHIKHLYILSLS